MNKIKKVIFFESIICIFFIYLQSIPVIFFKKYNIFIFMGFIFVNAIVIPRCVTLEEKDIKWLYKSSIIFLLFSIIWKLIEKYY